MFYFIISYQKGKRLYCERNLTLLEDTWTANITQYIEILKAQNFIDICITWNVKYFKCGRHFVLHVYID